VAFLLLPEFSKHGANTDDACVYTSDIFTLRLFMINPTSPILSYTVIKTALIVKINLFLQNRNERDFLVQRKGKMLVYCSSQKVVVVVANA